MYSISKKTSHTINWSMSLSKLTFGKSGIIWATTLNPASLAIWNDSVTALTVWPLEAKTIHPYFTKNLQTFLQIHPRKLQIRKVSCALHEFRKNLTFFKNWNIWPVCVSGNIFIDTLYSYFKPSAAIPQHVTEIHTTGS